MEDVQSNVSGDEKHQFKILLTAFGTFIAVVIFAGLLVNMNKNPASSIIPYMEVFIFGFLPGAVGLAAIWYRVLNKNEVPTYVRRLSWVPLLYIPIYLVMFLKFLSILAAI